MCVAKKTTENTSFPNPLAILLLFTLQSPRSAFHILPEFLVVISGERDCSLLTSLWLALKSLNPYSLIKLKGSFWKDTPNRSCHCPAQSDSTCLWLLTRLRRIEHAITIGMFPPQGLCSAVSSVWDVSPDTMVNLYSFKIFVQIWLPSED